tara:strand:+ start:623 stop:1405 length:783 start_codon:yes stop_codon:yes gene_type:complete
MKNPYTSFVNLDDSLPTKQAIMFFPQEWESLINCLPLINYYSSKYVKIKLIMRSDASSLTDFYISQFKNVRVIYHQKSRLDFNFNRFIKLENRGDILFFGDRDAFRLDGYTNRYRFSNSHSFSLNRLYETYDILYSERVHSFSIDRNHLLENELFNSVVGESVVDYIVVDPEYTNELSNHKIIYLDDDLPIIFNYIKILENAKEIYLTNSKWAYVCYLLDAKYGIFSNIKINLICEDNKTQIFTEPKELNNWNIKTTTDD